MSFRPAPPPPGDDDDTVRMPRLDLRSFLEDAGTSPCERVAEQVAQAVDGALPLALELHLDECAVCTELLRAATMLSENIRRAARGYEHAQDFEARVLAALVEADSVGGSVQGR
jgi:hypothetical protein